MRDQKVKALVDCWPRFEESLEAFDLWFDACHDEPEICWLAILMLAQSDLSGKNSSLLAAGPLEDLLVLHGADFIDRVENEAKDDSKFNHLLGGVWRQDMPLDIWERIERARKEVW